GSGLRTSASLSLGPGMILDPLEAGTDPFSGQEFLKTVLTVDAAVSLDTRDLIYTDPDLAGTPLGSVVRVPNVVQVFSEVSRVDLDGSGRVDGLDLARLARQFGLSQGQVGFDPAADLDLDGDVDGDDLIVMSIDFGRKTLKFDASTLPPPPAVLGVEYEHRITFLGGNLFLEARKLDGDLPDGLTLTVDVGAGGPEDSALVISGIPAQVGTFTTTVQVVDAFFAIADQSIVVTVQPMPPAP
ncbi:MAG: hypothetical protein ACE5ID_07635, partial [Acidobacteriota bacterium]